MAIIGSIVIGMVAQTDKFMSGLAKAQKALGNFGSGIGSFLAGPVGRLETALAGVGRSVAAAFDTIDKTGDMADRIGIATASLQELRYAAKMTGTETEALDNAVMKFSKNLGEAATNDISPAAKAIRSLGLDPKQLATMDMTEAFSQVADGIKSMGNEAQQNAKAAEIFGKGGIMISNTLRAGGAEIRKFSAELNRMGGTVTEQHRQRIAQLMDSLDKASTMLIALGTQVAVAVTPFVDAAVQSFQKLGEQGMSAGELVAQAMGWIVRRMGDVADFIQGARNVFYALELVASKVFVAIMDGAATLARGFDKLLYSITGYTTGMGDALSDMAVEFKKTSTEFQDSIWKAMGDDAWGDKFRTAADMAIAKSKEMADAAVAANKKTKKQLVDPIISEEAHRKQAEKALADYQNKAKQIYEDMRTPMDIYEEKIRDIKEVFEGGAISAEVAGRAMAKARAEMVGEGPGYAGALEYGTAEARSAVLQAGRSDAQDKTAKNTAETVAYLKRIEEQLRLQDLSPPLPMVEFEMA